MQTNIIKIGNSQGIRIPASIIKQHNLQGSVRLINTSKGLLISPDKPRKNWQEAFKLASSQNTSKEDKVLLDVSNQFDQTEWQW